MTEHLKQVGWLVWNKLNPAHTEFSTIPLTDADKEHGYCSEAVYTLPRGDGKAD